VLYNEATFSCAPLGQLGYLLLCLSLVSILTLEQQGHVRRQLLAQLQDMHTPQHHTDHTDHNDYSALMVSTGVSAGYDHHNDAEQPVPARQDIDGQLAQAQSHAHADHGAADDSSVLSTRGAGNQLTCPLLVAHTAALHPHNAQGGAKGAVDGQWQGISWGLLMGVLSGICSGGYWALLAPAGLADQHVMTGGLQGLGARALFVCKDGISWGLLMGVLSGICSGEHCWRGGGGDRACWQGLDRAWVQGCCLSDAVVRNQLLSTDDMTVVSRLNLKGHCSVKTHFKCRPLARSVVCC
jgi:hypothetical protein